jgi:hypothetical protein
MNKGHPLGGFGWMERRKAKVKDTGVTQFEEAGLSQLFFGLQANQLCCL